MRCPTCGKEILEQDNPYRPFCSGRCKLIDLDNWLSGRYRISTPITADAPQNGVTGSTGTAGRVPDTEAGAKADRD
jgi:endogenous inhibitor of DNA gyrase (YacG/DUF329 family)